jgi:hypothetical protein
MCSPRLPTYSAHLLHCPCAHDLLAYTLAFLCAAALMRALTPPASLLCAHSVAQPRSAACGPCLPACSSTPRFTGGRGDRSLPRAHGHVALSGCRRWCTPSFVVLRRPPTTTQKLSGVRSYIAPKGSTLRRPFSTEHVHAMLQNFSPAKKVSVLSGPFGQHVVAVPTSHPDSG